MAVCTVSDKDPRHTLQEQRRMKSEAFMASRERLGSPGPPACSAEGAFLRTKDEVTADLKATAIMHGGGL